MRHLGLRIAIVLLLALGALFMFRRQLTNAMLFYPERGQWRSPGNLGLEYQELWVEAEDGVRTQAWFMPARAAQAMVLFFHGNAGTMADRLERAVILVQQDCSVLFSEYRGYGDSQGRPSEAGLYMDGRAAFTIARNLAGSLPVVVAGRSLGGAVAIEVATTEDPDAVVIESSFTSLREMAGRTGIPLAAKLVAYEFPSEEKIKRLRAPLLITHGDRDELVPYAMGQRLRDAAQNAARVDFHTVRGGTHNETPLEEDAAHWDAWRRFIARVVGSATD